MKTTFSRLHVAALGTMILAAAVRPSLASGPAPTQSEAQYEVRFMTEMIDHHAMAVMMAQMCIDKAIHPELVDMCNEIIAAQTQEIATMQTWLLQWYGVSYQAQTTQGMQQHMERMADLSAEEFEIAFMKSMIRHHWKAVVRASGCIDRAYHEALVTMCADIVEAQVAEITQLRTWLCDWYGVCNYGPKGDVSDTQ